ncbi:MAG: hypothetical protein KTR30_26080 [Saprospiraceae bacterium]|nr:hypothetical protein [Saprospiraceae bacterium]
MILKTKKQQLQALQSQWGKPKKFGFNFSLIQEYFDLKPVAAPQAQVNDRAVTDLDIHPFYEFIDRSCSAPGQQVLYYNIRQLSPTKGELKKQEEWVQHYTQAETARWQSQLLLGQLAAPDDYYFPYMLYGKLPTRPKYFPVLRILQLLFFVGLFAAFINRVFVLGLVLVFAINLLLHYREKVQIGTLSRVFSRLGRLNNIAKKLIPFCPLSQEESDLLREQRKAIHKVVKKISFLNTDTLQDNEVAAVGWYAMELIKIATLSEVLTFYQVIDDIARIRPQIEGTYLFVAEVDIALSIASLRAGLPFYCQPNFSPPAKQLQVQGLIHPLVKNCVPNDLTLQGHSLLLTGSNMSGKSTFIRALNLNVIAAQTFNTVFAQSYTAPQFAIASSIRISDDLLDEKSYYMEEVNAIGELLQKAETSESPTLFTIDEVFKGTNTIERVSAAKAILEYLNQGKHLVLVSTHDIELTQLLESGFQLHCFQEQIEDQQLSFDYKLRPGALTKRNAISILEIAGYPSSIIAEARKLSEELEGEKIKTVKQ